MPAQILIVEDEEDLLEVLEYRLSKEGYDTLGFLSTKNVRQAISEESIDLIIMDRNLPDIEGSEFIAMLRDQGMQIPVIYLSAKATKYHIEEGFLRGADDYMTKPFSMRELLVRVKTLLRRVRLIREEIEAEAYGLAKVIYVYVLDPPNASARAVLDYLFSPQGRAAIEATHVWPLPRERAAVSHP